MESYYQNNKLDEVNILNSLNPLITGSDYLLNSPYITATKSDLGHEKRENDHQLKRFLVIKHILFVIVEGKL